MIEFLYHEGILKEIVALQRRFRTIEEGFSIVERLFEKHFHPTSPQQVIPRAKLHRVTQNDIWTLWKIELVMPNSGLRPSQWPRVWFVVKGAIIAFLCVASHVDNYNDEEISRVALSRVSDIF